MISKKVGISPKNDNYARLASYIADAGKEGEKCLMAWCAGCLGGDDYKSGMAEAVAVQDTNSRTTQSKTYHLVISFRQEDESRLSPEIIKAIEERFATALGYGIVLDSLFNLIILYDVIETGQRAQIVRLCRQIQHCHVNGIAV